MVAALAVLAVAGAALSVRSTGVQPLRVASTSMAPAIGRGDWVVTRDLDRPIRRNDVVLFRFPLGTEGRAVKRVVALAGDDVEIRPRSVVAGGRTIAIAGAPGENAARRRVETVPKASVFLLGDNAAVSVDSRSFGAVPETEVVGRVLFVVPSWAMQALLGVAVAFAVIAGLAATRRGRPA